MKVKDIIKELDLEVVVESSLEKEVRGGYSGDLLSNVMARAKKGDIWLTVQSHQNVVAVALLTEVSAVIIVEGFSVEEKAVERAREKGVNILKSDLTAYELAGLLYQMDFSQKEE